MPFSLMKKKYKFQVDLVLQELTAVSFVNGTFLAKVRLVDGGRFLQMSQREDVKNNCVKWDKRFCFDCNMTANANTGELASCICKVSVRKETKGGKSFEKLGFANINLAEFAGAGLTTRRYLLEGYNTKHRQDNSMLQVTLKMVLLAGDPLFKPPPFRQPVPPGDKQEVQLPATKKELVTGAAEDKDGKDEEQQQDFELGHSRNSSYASQQSKASGYSSLPSHSRQSSAESGHHRNLSSSSTFSDMGLSGVPKVPDRKRPSKKQPSDENRMDSTRVSAKEVINEVFEATNLEPDDSTESPGLQLIIQDDGTPALGSHDLPVYGSSHCFEQVIIAHR